MKNTTFFRHLINFHKHVSKIFPSPPFQSIWFLYKEKCIVFYCFRYLKKNDWTQKYFCFKQKYKINKFKIKTVCQLLCLNEKEIHGNSFVDTKRKRIFPTEIRGMFLLLKIKKIYCIDTCLCVQHVVVYVKRISVLCTKLTLLRIAYLLY